MLRFVYPNAAAEKFLGCGRYEVSFPNDKAGIEPVTPDTPGIAEIHAAALKFAPGLSHAGKVIYETKDSPSEVYQGDSLDLAYFLAMIHCSRQADLPYKGNCDIWCTGSIDIKGDGLPFLKTVDFGSFSIKLDAFLSEENHDRLFIIPAGNVEQKHKILFAKKDIQVLMLNHIREQSLCFQDIFRKKTILVIHGNEIESLVNLIFAPAGADVSVEDNTVGSMKISLIYKRRAQPDEYLLNVLENHLIKAGHSVFIDRNMKIGDEWEKRITHEIRNSDAVVILLSPISIYSEMLAYEIDVACHAALENKGKPRLFPVRINFEDPLPQELSNKLASLQYALWRGTEDDIPLVRELTERLENPPLTAADMCSPLEMVGGAMPLDSKFYVVRPIDDAFHAAVLRRDTIVLLKGARQAGKTSLLARGLQKARENGVLVVLTDFQKLIDSQLQSLESFFFAVGEMLADQLDIDVCPQDKWRTNRAPNTNFERYFRREILATVQQPLLWAMDEADRLFHCKFGSEVFSMFRTWHNERALTPGGPCSRLTLAIAYATEAYLFIKDQNQSPFNVGTKLVLEDFTTEQVADLNTRYGSPMNQAELRRFYQLTGGQPYLVRRALNDMVSRNICFDEFAVNADHDDGTFGDHLRRMLIILIRDPQLSEIVRGILQGQPCPDYESFYRLRSGGILKGDSKDHVYPRCEIYATYLRKHLL